MRPILFRRRAGLTLSDQLSKAARDVCCSAFGQVGLSWGRRDSMRAAHMPLAPEVTRQKRGRKPTWREGYLEQARKLAALGATEVEMANFFGVSHKTFTRWKVSRSDFCRALKTAKETADARVERRLYERAVGYSMEVEKIVCLRGKVIRVKTVEYYPPDVTACIFWLKNRQPDRWRDRVVDPAQAGARFNFIGMVPTEEEWIARYASNPEPLVIGDTDKNQR
jgi:hypothetical protein